MVHGLTVNMKLVEHGLGAKNFFIERRAVCAGLTPNHSNSQIVGDLD